RAAVKRLMLNGCTINTLSFDSPLTINANAFRNIAAPADKTCHIFDPAGGGVVYQSKPSALSGYDPAWGPGNFEYLFVDGLAVKGVGTDGTNGRDVTALDLLIILMVPPSVCHQINVLNNIDDSDALDGPWFGEPAGGDDT